MAKLSAYIREVLRIGADCADTIFFGEYLGKDGATLDAPIEVYYTVHRNPQTGARACVLTNLGARPAQFSVSFVGNTSIDAMIYRPFEPVLQVSGPTAGTIAREGLVIVVEDVTQSGGGNLSASTGAGRAVTGTALSRH